MFKDPFASIDFNKPFGARRSRNLFGAHTTPREWKHGARDIPFGMGAMSLYVDGTNGHDSNDGESWKTAKKTIQEAVDTADSWTQIFIKAGTYDEEVDIATQSSISLIGESRDNTIIAPTSYGTPLTFLKPNCTAFGLELKTPFDDNLAANIRGDSCRIDNCTINATMNYGNGISGDGNNITINAVKCVAAASYGIFPQGAYWEVANCYLDGCRYGIWSRGDYCKFYNNEIRNTTYRGIYIESGSDNNSIFHNNIVGNATQVEDAGTNNKFFENFYDDHTNIDNGFGIATEPYAFTGGSDPRPVVCRNGWNSISLLRSLLRKKTAAQTSQAATDANGTAWVDLKSIAPTTSDIELYRLKLTTAGTWAGTAKYRIIIGATKVYPFGDDKDIDTGVLEDLIFPINIQINETCKIQFRSDNAGDGAGETVALDQLDYATVL